MEYWTDIYKELASKIIRQMPAIKWVDLWHDQVSYLTEELPFPAPAVFISFKVLDTQDKGLKIQDCNTQIDFRLFYETFTDTAFSSIESFGDEGDTLTGSYNQGAAIDFMRSLTDIHKIMHGQSGENYSAMRRLDMGAEESGGSGNLYRVSFACMVEDASAMDSYDEKDIPEVTVDLSSANIRPQPTDETPLFLIS